jgi:hypothetical protein
MRTLDPIPFEMDAEAIFGRLHLDPRSQYADEVNSMIDRARQLARPRAAYEVAFVQERGDDSIVIGREGTAAEEKRARFRSRVLRANLDEVERVFPYVASCGPELDSILVSGDDIFSQFCRDTIKETALHAAILHLVDHLKESYALESLVSMNPGSGDINVWPIEQQRELFAFFGDVEESIGVILTESCLMVPNKSVSGLLYPSEEGFQSCQLCHRERCPNRRAPFDPHLWEERLGS